MSQALFILETEIIIIKEKADILEFAVNSYSNVVSEIEAILEVIKDDSDIVF